VFGEIFHRGQCIPTSDKVTQAARNMVDLTVAPKQQPCGVQMVERVGLVAHLSRETGGHRLGAAKLVRFARYECSR
jgi:hypothetical protein